MIITSIMMMIVKIASNKMIVTATSNAMVIFMMLVIDKK